MFFVWGRYARIAKKCGQVFTTHSFTNPILYPCLNYILPQTFHSLNFRINIKRNTQPFSIECSLLENGGNSNLTYLLHYTKLGWRKRLGRIEGSELAPSLRKYVQLGKRQSHFLWGDPI